MDRTAEALVEASSLQSNRPLQLVGRSVSWFGGTGVVLLALILWLGGRLFGLRRAAHMGLRGAEGIAVASAVSFLVKVVAGRARPYVTPGEPCHWHLLHGFRDAAYFSMPSGHTASTFGFAVAVSVVALGFGCRPRRAVTALAVAVAVLVAFARVYSHEHWLSDVIVGAVLGSVTGAVLTRWHTRNPGGRFDRLLLGPAAN